MGRCSGDGTVLDRSCSVTHHSIVPALLGFPGPQAPQVLLELLLLQCAHPAGPCPHWPVPLAMTALPRPAEDA